MNNILNINFEEGKIIAKAGGLWQWDKGQKIRVFGTGITQDAEIHFSLMEKGGSSVTLTGVYDSGLDALIADIPNTFLANESLIDYKLYAFLYVRGEGTAETVYKIILTVKARPKPEGYDDNNPGIIIDDYPTENSDNLVTSGGVYSALEEMEGKGVLKIVVQNSRTDTKWSELAAAITNSRTVFVYSKAGSFYTSRDMMLPMLSTGKTENDKDYVDFGCSLKNFSPNTGWDELYIRALEGTNDNISFDFKSANQWEYQDKIIFDSVPMQNSSRPITSGGVYGALRLKTESFKVTFTSTGTTDPETYVTTYETACNKTLVQIWEAYSSGKYVYAEHVIDGMSYYLPVIESRQDYFSFGRNLITCLHPEDPTAYHSWSGIDDSVRIYLDYQTQEETCKFVEAATTIPTILEAVEKFKVTAKLEIGNDAYAEADKTYSIVKSAVEAGKYVYMEARFYTDHQDESTYSHSVYLPVKYQTNKENEEAITFSHSEYIDYGSSYDAVYVYLFSISITGDNGLSVAFPGEYVTLAKKSAHDALEQRVAALEQALANT